MEENKYFGLQIPLIDGIDAQDIAARMFLCPRFSMDNIAKMLKMLANGKLTVPALMKKTEDGINQLKLWKDGGFYLPTLMDGRLEKWTQEFGKPKMKEFKYIEKKYGFTKVELFGNEPGNNTTIPKNIMDSIDSPQALADYVKQYIKGQDKAIEDLAVPFFLHLDSKRNNTTCRIITPTLLMGPTGVGKSELLRIFGEVCDCPLIRINTSKIQPNGWKGYHITDIIAQQLSKSITLDDLKYAIIVFHEFDKITHYGQKIVGNNGTDADADMMREIMSLFETNEFLYFEDGFDSNNLSSRKFKLPVDNLLIVFDGAFSGIETIIKKRLSVGPSIGFTSENRNNFDGINLQSLVNNEDLIQWGYTPELLGRIGNIVVMNPLSAEDMFQILTTAKDNILQSHFDYFAEKNMELQISDEALYYIADEAHKSGLGFRNVKMLLYKTLRSLYYNMPKDTLNKRIVKVNKDYVMKCICEQQL